MTMGRHECRQCDTVIHGLYIFTIVFISAFFSKEIVDHYRGISAFIAFGENQHYAILRFAALAAGVGLTIFLAQKAWAHTQRTHWTTWWDPSTSRPDGEISWNDVAEFANVTYACDPIRHEKILRKPYLWKMAPLYISIAICYMLLAAVAYDFIAHARVPNILDSGDQKRNLSSLLNVSSNLTAYLALLAAITSIYFTYHQLRAKVRADNRQQWIGTARNRIARVTALAIEYDVAKRQNIPGNASAPKAKRREESLRESLNKLRLELELMLNPVEKDHRLLMSLIQKCQFTPTNTIEDFFSVKTDIESAVLDTEARDILLGIMNCDDLGKTVSCILRLSHVVLKREWERVKHTK